MSLWKDIKFLYFKYYTFQCIPPTLAQKQGNAVFCIQVFVSGRHAKWRRIRPQSNKNTKQCHTGGGAQVHSVDIKTLSWELFKKEVHRVSRRAGGGIHVITPMALMQTIRTSQCQQSEQMCEKWCGDITILRQENPPNKPKAPVNICIRKHCGCLDSVPLHEILQQLL